VRDRVTSRIRLIEIPVACSALRADSRPGPGALHVDPDGAEPLLLRLAYRALGGHLGRKRVPFREPLNPDIPDDAQEMTFPVRSVMVTMVLLNVDWMWAIPSGRFLLALFSGLSSRIGHGSSR